MTISFTTPATLKPESKPPIRITQRNDRKIIAGTVSLQPRSANADGTTAFGDQAAGEIPIRLIRRVRHRRFFGRRREIRAIRMLEHQRAHARFRFHHHALGQMAADVFRPQQGEQPLLVV